jgi:heme exporter protein D
MTWASWNDFFAMGGYSLYMWSAYDVTAALILTEVALLRLRRRAVLRQLASGEGVRRP